VERFVQSITQECLDHFAICGPEHMSHLIREYVEHSHRTSPPGEGERTAHRSADDSAGGCGGEIVCRERLGGVLRHYYRAAA
jgi:putative transposase